MTINENIKMKFKIKKGKQIKNKLKKQIKKHKTKQK